MRYLIYSCCFEAPHFETEMEVAKIAISEGHEVFFVICESDLRTCFVNPRHKGAICYTCRSKIRNGIDFLNIPNERIIRLSQFIFRNDIAVNDSFTSINELKKFEYKGSDIGLAVASSIISYTRDHEFDVLKYKDEIKDGIATAIMVHEKGEQILDSVNPDVVIMFNGRFLEYRPLMRLCEKRSIDFYTHERGGSIDRYMMRKNSTPHTVSFSKMEIEELWRNAGEDKYVIGKEFFLNRRNKVMQSWDVYTKEQQAGILPTSFDRSKRNIGIFNSSMDEYEGIADFKNGLYADDNAGIEQLCTSFSHLENYHFYLRVHPNLKGIDNAQNRSIAALSRFANLTIIPADDPIDSYALMDAVDVVITFGSTMGIEAVFWNKSSLLLGRAFHEDLGGIIKPESHQQAVETLIDIPATTPNDDALKYGYWVVMFGVKYQHFKADGLFSGKFLNKKIEPSIGSKIKSKIDVLVNGK